MGLQQQRRNVAVKDVLLITIKLFLTIRWSGDVIFSRIPGPSYCIEEDCEFIWWVGSEVVEGVGSCCWVAVIQADSIAPPSQDIFGTSAELTFRWRVTPRSIDSYSVLRAGISTAVDFSNNSEIPDCTSWTHGCRIETRLGMMLVQHACNNPMVILTNGFERSR